MWTIVTGVDIEQLDGWVQNMTENGQVKLSVIQEKISSMSPVEGLDVTGFKSMWKSLLKTTKATKISSDGTKHCKIRLVLQICGCFL